jgi:hypothetical protein
MAPIFGQLDGVGRLFIKTLMGNALPIFWLFVLQSLWGVQFDGGFFWSLYGGFSLLGSIGLWVANRKMPDRTYLNDREVSTPIRGCVAAVFQIIVYLTTMFLYFALEV